MATELEGSALEVIKDLRWLPTQHQTSETGKLRTASDICLWLLDSCCLLLMNNPKSETFLVNKSETEPPNRTWTG